MKIINYLITSLFIVSCACAMEQEEKFIVKKRIEIESPLTLKQQAQELINDLKDVKNYQEYKLKLIQNQYDILSLRAEIRRILNEPLSDEDKKLLSQLDDALEKFETDRMRLARRWGYEAGEFYQ